MADLIEKFRRGQSLCWYIVALPTRRQLSACHAVDAGLAFYLPAGTRAIFENELDDYYALRPALSRNRLCCYQCLIQLNYAIDGPPH